MNRIGMAKTLGAVAALLCMCGTSALAAAPQSVVLPGARVFPESLSSTADGTLYIGSIGEGGVMRAAPGATQAGMWIRPGANGSRSTFGIRTDARADTLFVCSNDVSAWGIPGPSDEKGGVLKAFDLRTGAAKGSYPLPGAHTFCNDIAIGPDGTAYVTDTANPHILRLRPGADRLEIWASDPRFAPPKGGGGLDGIAIGADGNVYVTTFTPGDLYRVQMRNGTAGPVTQLHPSRKLVLPDALRADGAGFLLIEGGGRLDRVTVDGNAAKIQTLKGGFFGPVSVTRVGDIAWVVEGRLAYLFDPHLKGQPPRLPFRVYPVTLQR